MLQTSAPSSTTLKTAVLNSHNYRITTYTNNNSNIMYHPIKAMQPLKEDKLILRLACSIVLQNIDRSCKRISLMELQTSRALRVNL